MPQLDTSCCLFENGSVASGSEFAWERARASYSGGDEDFDWRYSRAPDGACAAVVTDGEHVVSRVLGTRKRAVLDGESVFFIEVSDVYNDFEHHGGLARAVSLQQCGEAFAKGFGGRAPEGHPVLYGTPTRRAHRFGLRRFKWEILRSEARLRVRPQGHCIPPAPGVEIEELERFPDGVAAVAAEVGASRGAMIVRDAERWNHRYCDRPGHDYALAAAKKEGDHAGYCILANGAIVDWLCPHEKSDVAAGLVAWADERVRSEGHDSLEVTFPETSPEWLLFQRFGFWIEGGRDYTAFRSFQKPYIMSWLFHQWFYMEGDSGRV